MTERCAHCNRPVYYEDRFALGWMHVSPWYGPRHIAQPVTTARAMHPAGKGRLA